MGTFLVLLSRSSAKKVAIEKEIMEKFSLKESELNSKIQERELLLSAREDFIQEQVKHLQEKEASVKSEEARFLESGQKLSLLELQTQEKKTSYEKMQSDLASQLTELSGLSVE